MFLDSKGSTVKVGRELGRGGEGAVFEVVGTPDVVAKIYHRQVTAEKQKKLAIMAGLTTLPLLEIAAWPTGVLYRKNSLAGILLPRVTGFKDIHILYSPAHRKADFPKADWAFLVHTARNVAEAFATIHRHGHVIGDVNQGNVVVSAKATIKFIDCDSFQISHNGSSFLCEVGVAHFTPPELQGRSFQGILRSQNHDNFGLAALIFHLLFMGRHPFAGRYHGSGDMPIERAIAELRFAFATNATARQMSPPPHALGLASASTGVATLFERAFSPTAAKTTLRPTAVEWVSELDKLRRELQTCTVYTGHKFSRALSDCPWCEIDRAGGPDFFISITGAARLATGFDLPAAWAAILAVAHPPADQLPTITLTPPAVARPVASGLVRGRHIQHATAATAVAMVVASFTFLPPQALIVAIALALVWLGLRLKSPYGRERAARRAALRNADSAWRTTTNTFQKEMNNAIAQFQTKIEDLDERRSTYQHLTTQQERDRQALEMKREEMQRQQHLERFFIDQAQLKGIGPSLKRTLASYGIETAADVTASKVEAVPGFGPKKTQTLVSWRASAERGFRFDPKKGVPPTDLAALEQRYASKRYAVERALRSGPAELKQISAAAHARRAELVIQMQRLKQKLEQRRADMVVI